MRISNWMNANQLQIAIITVVLTGVFCFCLCGMRSAKKISMVCAIVWIVAIIYKTLIVRNAGHGNQFSLIPFISYYRTLLGNKGVGEQILLNILLFIPLGCFLRMCKWPWWIGFYLAVSIEVSQGLFQLGYCELDDVMSNTLGTIIGFVYVNAVYRRKDHNA